MYKAMGNASLRGEPMTPAARMTSLFDVAAYAVPSFEALKVTPVAVVVLPDELRLTLVT